MSEPLRRAFKSTSALLVLFVTSAFAAACGDDSTTAPGRTVDRVVVTPTQLSLLTGESKEYAASALDAAGSEIQGKTITWSSTDAAVASVSATGVVTALQPGTTVIKATADGRSGSGALQVELAPVATVTIDPAQATLIEGEARNFTAVTKDAAGHVVTGRAVTWKSSNESAATVSAAGLVTAIGAGNSVVRATVEGRIAEAAVNVTAAAVASVELSQAAITIEEGESRTVTAVAKDAAGRVLQGRTITWTSDDATIATVDNGGRITAVKNGLTNIVATSEGRRATAVITVNRAAVATVSLTPGAFVAEIGESRQMTAVAKDARGSVLQGRTVQWSVTAGMATISPLGVMTAMRHGYATIQAAVDGVAAAVAVTITPSEEYGWDLLFNRFSVATGSEIFTLTPGAGTAPVKLNAGNVGRSATSSPNGQRIAFAVSMQDPTTNAWIHDIFAVDRSGMNMKRLTTDPGQESNPAWSPVGSRIAYSQSSVPGRSDIWIMNEDGSGAINLTADMPAVADRGGASWSPDGSRIAFRELKFNMFSGESETRIYTMRADGSDKREITMTTTGFDGSPSWSPNGATLAFARYYDANGEQDITLVPSNGGTPQRIRLPGRQSMPAWSPDGQFIAFVQEDSGRQNVYTMRADGSRVLLRTVDPAWGGGLSPSWIRK